MGVHRHTIQELRRALGLSQDTLAAKAKISQTLISSLESGTATLTRDTAAKLAAALGTDAGELLNASIKQRVEALANSDAGELGAAIKALSDIATQRSLDIDTRLLAAKAAAEMAQQGQGGGVYTDAFGQKYRRDTMGRAIKTSDKPATGPHGEPTYQGGDGRVYYRDNMGKAQEVR